MNSFDIFLPLTIVTILIQKMPWTGLLLVTHFCFLCQASPVNVSEQLMDQLMKHYEGLGMESGEPEDDVLNPVSSDELSEPLMNLGEDDLDSGEVPGSADVPGERKVNKLLPQIPGLETGADGELYFQGNRVKSITDLGSNDNDADGDDDDDDEVVHDDDGVIEPDVDWLDEVVHDDDGVIEPDVDWLDDDTDNKVHED